MKEFSSISSRSFREMVLMKSIMSVFNTRPENKSTSRATSSSNGGVLEPTVSADAQKKDIENDSATVLEKKASRATDVTNATIKEGDVAQVNIRADPFAGGIEGGVEYKSMAWW